MAKQLGRGLEDLFIDNSYLKEATEDEQTKEISLHKIIPNPHQPRKHFDEKSLNELAESIKEHGVISPIIVTFDGFKYIIVAGERRYRASKLAGLTTIPAIVRDYSEKSVMEIALLENIQREDLTPIEIAKSYKEIIDKLEITQEEFGKRIGKSRAQITNMLGLLQLPEVVIDMINDGKLTMGHARALSKLEDEERIVTLAKKIVEEGLSVRDVEAICSLEGKKREPKDPNKAKKVLYTSYETILRDKIKQKVKVQNNKIVIPFSSEDELKEIIDKIK